MADLVALDCETCGKTFEVTPYKATLRRFCSRACASAGYDYASMAPIERARFYSRAWRDLRSSVLRRDSHQCRLCGGTYRLAVHHVIPWVQSQDDSPSNLVTLCNPCHMRADMALRKHGEILDFGEPLDMGGVPS